MKLILENWRKFLNESIEENLSKLGLHMEQTNYGYNIAIMDVSDMSKYPKVIGMIETVKSEKPCIPKTHEIGTVATHPSVRGSGVGTYLYEVAALLVHKNFKGGITSDHQSSTTNDAKQVWDRLENKFNYVKRKTPKGPSEETFNSETGEVNPNYKGGNNKFDYDGSTADPLDDCDNVDTSYAEPATDHSLGIPSGRASFVENMMNKQLQNYQNYKSQLSDGEQQKLDGYIMRNADKLFNVEYKPQSAGIYGQK